MAHEFEAISGQIIEAVIDVHKQLGPGFLEQVYERAVAVALRTRGIPFVAQLEVPILYMGEQVGLHRLDLIVGNEVVVELKAVKELDDIYFAQVRSYLKATGLHVGLLINFNAPTLVVKRIVL